MDVMNKKGKGSSVQQLSFLHNLISVREMLSLRSMRLNHINCILAFPLAMIFVNVQGFFLNSDIGLFGLPDTTIAFIAFVLGAIVMFAFSSNENISAISKLSAVITLLGFIPWFFIPNRYLLLIFSAIFMAGIGGCVSSSSFYFVFVLNNVERFFGSVLILVLINSVKLADQLLTINPITRKIISLVIIGGLCVCMLSFKKKDCIGVGENEEKKLNPGVWLAMFVFLSYFVIRIMGFYAPAFGHLQGMPILKVLALVLTVACIMVQVLLKRSVWTLCNVFFLSSILAYVMWYIKMPKAAYLFSELKEVGFMISLYLVGCVTNKFCGFRMHKRLILLSLAVCGFLYVGIDVINRIMPTQTFAVVSAAVLFVVFLLLSPQFSRYLFFAEWSKEFRMIQMYSPGEAVPHAYKGQQKLCLSLDDTNLSPREKQVVSLLLRGMTLRQVAPELGLTVSTVSTYSKAIYKKLGINSRAELFMLFGYVPSES